MNRDEAKGIALIGTVLVDELLPILKPGQLTCTDANEFVPVSEMRGEIIQYSVGGMALNVAVNLAKLSGDFPISIIGKIGSDHRADLIRQTMRDNSLDTEWLIVDHTRSTSHTTVIYIEMPDRKVERLFRHTFGAMGSFAPADIELAKLQGYKFAMFGYGLLLPLLDLEDDHYGTRLGRIMAKTRQYGVKTAIDFVSPDRENLFRFKRYQKSIAYADMVIINDDQAQSLTEQSSPDKACMALVEEYKCGLGIVHCGAIGPNYAYSKESGLVVQPNYHVAPEEIAGNAGAGDAFSAAILHALYHDWSIREALAFAAAAAAKSLSHASCTGAMQNENEILKYMETRATKLQDRI
ncbi:hypothetical protein GF406_10630 [candidate division KSB1 bacterium]|nr:hypothetical protein [candidate division KSB1 bacterium]